ncbi:MAG: hypothetical protein D6751_07425 [Deltaproteobacteria bacterium]|nr:hypothetical protein AWN76_014855 [Rhodothermaceae bacterium RA]RMF45424.1 MAG: hypothetical protein D6751_07425 [Deltaproteobacteria bacterium]
MDYHPLYRHRLYLLGFVLLLTAGLAGCSLFNDDAEDACTERFTDTVRVIPCKGVDGVVFGDTPAEVKATLGPPTVNQGWMDGLYRGWRTYEYLDGPYSEMLIGFLIEDDGVSFGPLDFIRLRAPYDGKTREGIGIGSTRAEVEQHYGEPERIHTAELTSGTVHLLTYCVGPAHFFNLVIQGDTVEAMGMGYYQPVPEESPLNCQ